MTSRALAQLARAMFDADEIIRMRAADELEKATRGRPKSLAPYRQHILRLLGTSQPSLRWHTAQLIPWLRLRGSQRTRAVRTLWTWTRDESNIVRTAAMEALADISDGRLRSRVVRALGRWLHAPAPSLRARARRLLRRFQ